MAEAPAPSVVAAVRTAVADAAARALVLWNGGRTQVGRWEKEPGQPVCDADLTVDAMLKASLGAILPDAGWLSEETADNAARLEKRRIWVVDPIDGTKDFLAGKPGWAVSVALVDAGEPVLGLLAAPARDELWLACKGDGATRNGTPVHVRPRAELAGARIPDDRLTRIDRDLVPVAKPNSIALRMAMVAAGEADLIATLRWGNEWDIAAAALIAGGAGAVVTDALGDPLRFNQPRPTAFGVLCCAPGIHAEAVERLAPRARAVLGEAPPAR